MSLAVSHRIVGRSERAGGGTRLDAVTVYTPADYWRPCAKCGGTYGSGHLSDFARGPHAAHPRIFASGELERRGDLVVLRDCVGDDVTDWFAAVSSNGVDR